MRSLGALIALGVGLAGVTVAVALGVAPASGDAAVYTHQALQGELFTRSAHFGWILALSMLGSLFGDQLPLAAAILNACLAGALVGLLGWRSGWPGAALAAFAVLPHAPFAEVDVAWMLAVTIAAVAQERGALAWSSVAMGAAVLVSPTALVALPWLVFNGRGNGAARAAAPAAAAVLVIAVLVVLSGGEWIHGPRGVLGAPAASGGSIAHAVLALAPLALFPGVWLAVRERESRASFLLGVALCLPVLVAPRDVPAWWILLLPLGAVLPLGAQRAPKASALAAVALLVLSGHRLQLRIESALEDEAVVAAAVRVMAAQPISDRALVAPWTFGVRVSLALSGEPYGLRWRSHGSVVSPAWCERVPAAALTLPDDLDAARVAARRRPDDFAMVAVDRTWAQQPCKAR